MNCYSCDNGAINACKRCARTYCEDHGNAQYCSECLRPASALPSFNLYRSALLVLLVCTAAAVFLLIRPPGETRGSSTVFERAQSTATAVPQASATQAPRTSPTAAVTATPTESPFIEYVVQSGDSLFGIAAEYQPANATIPEYAEAIANLNGFTVDSPILVVGDTILLPKPPAE